MSVPLPMEGRLSPCRNGKALWLTHKDQSFGTLINGRATRLLLCGNVIHIKVGQVTYELQLGRAKQAVPVPLPVLEAA